MKKRLISLFLAVAMLCALLPLTSMQATAVTGVYTWIKDRNQVDGSDYTTSSALAAKLNQIFDGNASVYSDKSCTNLVDTRIGTSNVKNDGVTKYVGPYGKSAINSGTSCWIYANGVYYTLFGECTGNGSAGANSEKLNLSSTTSTTASYSNFKKWGVRQAVGALIRANGHSMIVLSYDENYLTILDGNGNSNGLVSIRVRSWDQVSFSVSYIIQPKESFFYEKYPTCSHSYNNVGRCSKCQEDFDFQATYSTDSAGIYTVSLSGGVYLRIDKPYAASTEKTQLIPGGAKVEVLGSVTNAFNHIWYKVSYNGAVGYTSEDNLKWYSYGSQEITCTLSSPAEGATVPKAAYPVIGTVTSKYPLQEVVAYIDGEQYATVTLGNTNTLEIRPSSINQLLNFAQLASGSHTLVIKARDIYRSSLVTVCTRRFMTEGNAQESCSHAYAYKATTAPTTSATGTLTGTCSKCSGTTTITLPKLTTTDYSYQVTKAATCTATGTGRYTWKTTSYGNFYFDVTIAKVSHSWESANCTTAMTCTVCGTTSGSALGHAWSDGDCMNPSRCANCGLTAGKGDHKVENGVCTVCRKYGYCGDNLNWTLDEEGTLTIFGSGNMTNYASGDAPWYSQRNSIKKININSGVTSIGSYAFSGCSSLTSVTIGDSVTSIGGSAFYGCSSLTSITILDSVTSIGDYAFFCCSSLTSITIPDSVTSIGSGAFSSCSSLTSVTIGDSVTSIGDSAFLNCSSLTSITIPDSVTSIGSDAFYGCSSLTSITIPDSVSSIGAAAFAGCSSLTSITIPDSVTSIGYYAFYECSSLTSINIPDSVTSIGGYAFWNCSSLTDVYYKGTESQWAEISISTYNESLENATIHFVIPVDPELNFADVGMVLGADIKGVFIFTYKPAESPYTSFKVIVNNNGVESEMELASESGNKTKYLAYAITMNAKEMADEVTVTIVGTTAEGEEYISNPYKWSIKQGAIEMLDARAGKTDEKSKNESALIANMLAYGAAAQKNFGYNLDNLVTDGLAPEYAALIKTTTPEMTGIPTTDQTGATVKLSTVGFNLAERIQVLPMFSVGKNAVLSDYKAVITQVHTNADGTTSTKTYTIEGTDCLKSGSYLGVYIDEMESNELRDTMTVTLYKGNTAVSKTNVFSPESVLNGLLESKNELVAAIMNYGDCAIAVFG